MGIDPDVVGQSGKPTPIAWTGQDSLLYAVSIGAGQDPLADLAFTTENSIGVEQKAFPTMAALLAQRADRPSYGDYDPTMVVHAEQALRWPRPLPPSGEAVLQATVTAVHDKGSGAVVVSETTATDLSGRALFVSTSSIFVRGYGGFGGNRGSAAPWELPDRAPDGERRVATRPEQALLYRLNGDRNPLHSDPEFARKAGFAAPILHGLCVYGVAARALVDVFDGELGSMSARFVQPVTPGEVLTTKIWCTSQSTAVFRTEAADGAIVLDRGAADIVSPA
jgi:acyl dehydratase